MAPKEQLTPRWDDLFEWWILIELDFQDWGIDLTDALDNRPWQWFKNRLSSLVSNPNSRINRALVAKHKEASDVETT